MKNNQKSAKRSTETRGSSDGWTDEERAAMQEHARELKAAKRRGANKADGEGDLLAKIAEMPAADAAMAERLHAIITASAPNLVPRTWYGMPGYAKDGNVVCFFQSARSSRRGTRPSASTTRPTSTKAPCGRPLRAEGADPRRRGEDHRAREESGELTGGGPPMTGSEQPRRGSANGNSRFK